MLDENKEVEDSIKQTLKLRRSLMAATVFIALIMVGGLGYLGYFGWEYWQHEQRVDECKVHLNSLAEDVNFFCCYGCKTDYGVLGEYDPSSGCMCGSIQYKDFSVYGFS